MDRGVWQAIQLMWSQGLDTTQQLNNNTVLKHIDSAQITSWLSSTLKNKQTNKQTQKHLFVQLRYKIPRKFQKEAQKSGSSILFRTSLLISPVDLSLNQSGSIFLQKMERRESNYSKDNLILYLFNKSLIFSVALPTTKHLTCCKKEKKKLCFIQQRTLFLLTWYSFLRLKPMFSIFHNT